MKKVIFICAMAIGFLAVGCSSENKQEQMSDSSMDADTNMMMETDTGNVDTVRNTNSSAAHTDSVNRASTVNSDSVRQ